jgi:YfiH family protein
MIGSHSSTRSAHFAFTDRWGGVSTLPWGELTLGGAVGDSPEAVSANRGAAARALGLDPARVVWMRQVHGNAVSVVDAPWGAREIPEGDAVVTDRRGLALAVLVADCTPVLLADPEAGVIAAVHSGRPGLAAGAVPAAIEQMIALGAAAERITAATGPAACGSCYEVPAAMRDAVEAAAPGSAARTSWGTPAVDVPAGVRAQLEGAGVREIIQSDVCTIESPDHYSYRREGRTGRQAGYVWLD